MWLFWGFFSEGICSPKNKPEALNIYLSVRAYEIWFSTKIETWLGDIQAKLKGLPEVQKTSRKKTFFFLSSEIVWLELPASELENAQDNLPGSLSAGLQSFHGFIEVVLWYGLTKQSWWRWLEHLIKLASTEYEILVVRVRSLYRCACCLYPIHLAWRNGILPSTMMLMELHLRSGLSSSCYIIYY